MRKFRFINEGKVSGGTETLISNINMQLIGQLHHWGIYTGAQSSNGSRCQNGQ